MIKSVKRIALVLAAIFAVTALHAQQMMELPVDTMVRTGKLDNGLTYYIRHNETTKGQADFYIAQKVGSILEEDNQRGLAHFLEHMCFNGTKNFPGNSLIDWLESKGIKFGYNLNAYTGIDETVYYISNAPVATTAVQDSVLLILHDWADDLLLDPEEIDKERGVIHEEWRQSMVGQMRILENLLPKMYPGSKYGYRLPIGTMEVVDNFPPQALRDYYEAWYRPDQQGIIVVGDIDVDYIEGKIKELFSPIKMPANAKERAYEPVADTEGTIFAIGSDPEQNVAVAQMFFKTDAFPREMKNSAQYLLTRYMIDVLEIMLDERFNDIMAKPDAPFAQAGVQYGEYLVAKTKDALALVMVPKGNETLAGFEAAYRELLRAARGGFTESEYERARAEYLSRLEKAYNGRDKRQNSALVNECLENFTDGEPLISIDDQYSMMNKLAAQVPVQYVNMILPELVKADNRVLLMLAPQKDDFTVPSEADFAAVIEKVDGEEIAAHVDEVKTEPFIAQLPAPGKIVSVSDDAKWGTKVFTLSNGVKVVVKHTDFKKDDIRFAALALGGTSTIGDDQADNLIFLPVAASRPTLGTYTSADLEKYLKGKQASVSSEYGLYSRMLEGGSSVKDLPTLMEMIYMYFNGVSLDADEYAATQNMVASVLANQEVDPQYIFKRDLMKSIYDSPVNSPLTSEGVKNADRAAIEQIMRDGLANAADYTFYFVGDVDADAIKPLLEQYIATLPADAAKATKAYVPNLSRELKKGSGTDVYTTKMETPQTWCAVMVSGKMPFTAKNEALASIMGQILSNRLLKKIREEMGAVYSINAVSRMTRTGDNNVVLQIPFPMKPEMKNQVLEEIYNMTHDMADNIADDELNPIKEYMVKKAVENKELNSAWLDELTDYQVNGVDTFNGDVEVLNSITTQDVKNFAKDFLDQNNYRVVILDPEN